MMEVGMNAQVDSLPRFWKIEGYDSTKKIFEETLALSVTSEDQITALLQRLVCTHLTAAEIVAASIRRNSIGYAPFLEPRIDNRLPGRFMIAVGDNPHYIASILHGPHAE